LIRSGVTTLLRATRIDSGRFVTLVLAGMLAASAPAPAHAAENGAAGWMGVKVRAPFAERFSFQLLTEARLFEELNQARFLLLRPWFDVSLPFGLSVALGYDALLLVNPVNRQEHRLWQQLAHGHAWEHIRTTLQFRLEERFFSFVDDVSVRGRLLVGIGVPLVKELALLVSNEFFVSFNEVGGFDPRGYSENRIFGGFGWRFNDWMSTKLGYQNQWIDFLDLFNHTVLVNVAFTTPTRK